MEPAWPRSSGAPDTSSRRKLLSPNSGPDGRDQEVS